MKITKYEIEEINLAFEIYKAKISNILYNLVEKIDYNETNDLKDFNYAIKTEFQNELDFRSNLIGLDSFLADAFSDIFTLFLFHKNYNFNENFISNFVELLMFSGSNPIYVQMETVNFFKLNYNTKINYLGNIKIELESKRIKRAKCPFYNSQFKKEFVELTLKEIESNFFLYFQERFKPQIQNLIRLANQDNERVKIILFHLGLLGAYERGELEI